ncbi:type II toxin-antitoxin system RelE/ParE family toxin [Enterobacter ludwigii]|uniref:type II toxin-antitoxin system RelE family toxin n=1 Tax=Enterobacter TaxID=547 RepID=UPI000682609E|nr:MULTISPECIES: type II toxin-antitoxin system RelE/ParE family toxin [Enterobacter]MBQ0310677.1 type II toxin-antitoxin system RelE/ParE family toxin [Enterobacter ludwigii]MDP5161461.1 type II toxin-antitoxin system RelE/ParE family toxin [Enterobacter ludwigii]MDV8144632.1 type II toxin-antitoxin system RelE/ParE family toxin [Enterobacter ludwigii]MXV04056.1 addiction module toxin RelE [Enterobacter sp. ABFQC]QLW24601.1 type II toxin-antitoxin system RelE/ParE family toxin [Enterobacter s
MTYELVFVPRAFKEWTRLGDTVKNQFKKKLANVLVTARLHGLPDCDKIKFRSQGYRLVYQVQDNVVTVCVIAIGKREKSAVYHDVNKRL